MTLGPQILGDLLSVLRRLRKDQTPTLREALRRFGLFKLGEPTILIAGAASIDAMLRHTSSSAQSLQQ